jgi:hypothetical protein
MMMVHKNNRHIIDKAKKAAIEVLLHNAVGPYHGLPRTAGWGYPEPYTRDLMISILGIAVSDNQELLHSTRKVLETLAMNQSERGHIPSLVHDKNETGASDTTPLFLFGIGIFRQVTGDIHFLTDAAQKALSWMAYQSPTDRQLTAQQPTSDWRDEQWVLGYGLYVNALYYISLRMFGLHEKANLLRVEINQLTKNSDLLQEHAHEGLAIKFKPYYALWSYKLYSNEHFDLFGNSLAIISGLASQEKAEEIIHWIEDQCDIMRNRGELTVHLPPNFFPFVNPGDSDWNPRDEIYNNPGDYHNGGIWPFICGFYIAALVAAEKYKLAEEKLLALTEMIKASTDNRLEFGFNEWHKAQDGKPMGQNWQAWSAAMYLYAAKCVEEKNTLFFSEKSF